MPVVSVILPSITALFATIFVVAVVRRWLHNRRPYLLVWAIGITAFGLGAAAEAAFGLFGWNPLFFRIYYLCGAILTAAWLGQGTIQLLGRQPWTEISLGVLVLLSLYGTYEVVRARLEPAFMSTRIGAVVPFDGTSPDELISLAGTAIAAPNGALMDLWARAVADRAGVDYRAVRTAPERVPFGLRRDNTSVGTRQMVEAAGIRPEAAPGIVETPVYVVRDDTLRGAIELLPPTEMHGSAIVRATSNARSITPLFNVYGTLGLAGGAIYSAWLFFRKRILYHRMIGSVLIATGALAPALGGTLSRAGIPLAVQVSNLVGIVVIFIGFLQATRTDVQAPATRSVRRSLAVEGPGSNE
jgi:hypothetical protein